MKLPIPHDTAYTPTPRLLIFDWDGTLIDSEERIIQCVESAAQALALPIPSHERIRLGIGLEYKDQLQNLFPDHFDTLDTEAFRKCFEARFKQLNAQKNRPISLVEGALLTLQRLKESGFLLAIATSMPSKTLTPLLLHFDIHTLFDAIRCGDQALPKPHPQMLLDILTELNMRPSDAWMVGDTTYDMSMAQRAQMNRVAITYGVHSVEQLAQYNPLAYVYRFSQFSALIG